MKRTLVSLAILLHLNSIAFCGKTDLLMRAQDDETERGFKLKLTIPKAIEDGPRGDRIEIVPSRPGDRALKDNDGNFMLYSVESRPGEPISPIIYGINRFSHPHRSPGTSEMLRIDGRRMNITHISVDDTSFFDSVSTFGAVWSVLNMYEKELVNLGNRTTLARLTQRGKVRVFPHMTGHQFKILYPDLNYENYRGNAFYDYRPGDENGEHVLCFFPIDTESTSYTSQSSDVVFHESGHYVLQLLRPDLWHSTLRDVQAFHETFGDMTAFFVVLSFPELTEKVLRDTKGNLHVSSFLSVIGEKIVNRDASQCTTLSVLPSCEQHALSERLTRALYGTFADFFNARRMNSTSSLTELLTNTVRDFNQLFLGATIRSPLSSFIEFGRDLRTTGEPLFQYLVHTNFLRQGIDLTDNLLSPQICALHREATDSDSSKTIGCSTGKIIVKKKSFMSPLYSHNFKEGYLR
ncbi:MAG: hypothetical protein K2P93_02960 [Alphaproteobacteria bacterium]|nr:hypothetical protein [Alphaproteobacteria bacterium]